MHGLPQHLRGNPASSPCEDHKRQADDEDAEPVHGLGGFGELQEQLGMRDLHRRRNAARDPVLYPLGAELTEAQERGNLGRPAEFLDSLGVLLDDGDLVHCLMVNGAFTDCQARQRAVSGGIHTLFMDDEPKQVWQRVDVELQARAKARQHPASWAELGNILGVSRQNRQAWKTRGISRQSFQGISDALGWSLDQLTGRDPLPRRTGSTSEPAPALIHGEWGNRFHEVDVPTLYARLDPAGKEVFHRLLVAAGLLAEAKQAKGGQWNNEEIIPIHDQNALVRGRLAVVKKEQPKRGKKGGAE